MRQSNVSNSDTNKLLEELKEISANVEGVGDQMSDVENLEVFVSLKSDLLTYADVIELIGSLKEDSLRTRHWEKICSLCGVYESSSFLENRSFDEVITILFEKDLAPIADIIKVAIRENEVEKKLNEIKAGLSELTPKYEVNQAAQVLEGIFPFISRFNTHLVSDCSYE